MQYYSKSWIDKKRIEIGENGLNAIKKFPQIKFTEQILNT